jgi:hypothetical protein
MLSIPSAWKPKSQAEQTDDTRVREAVAHIASSFRTQHRARLSRALLRWACAAISLAAEAAATPMARKLRAAQLEAKQLSAKTVAAETRQVQGRRAAEEAEAALQAAQRALALAGRREAAERSRREAGEAVSGAERQRRAQVEARGAAMRRVMRGLGAGQVGRALATWRRHCCQQPQQPQQPPQPQRPQQPQQRLAPPTARPAPAATVWTWAAGKLASVHEAENASPNRRTPAGADAAAGGSPRSPLARGDAFRPPHEARCASRQQPVAAAFASRVHGVWRDREVSALRMSGALLRWRGACLLDEARESGSRALGAALGAAARAAEESEGRGLLERRAMRMRAASRALEAVVAAAHGLALAAALQQWLGAAVVATADRAAAAAARYGAELEAQLGESAARLRTAERAVRQAPGRLEARVRQAGEGARTAQAEADAAQKQLLSAERQGAAATSQLQQARETIARTTAEARVAAKRRIAAARTEAVVRAMAAAAAQRLSGAFDRWRLSACLCAIGAPYVTYVAPSTQTTPVTAPVTSWRLRRYRS